LFKGVPPKKPKAKRAGSGKLNEYTVALIAELDGGEGNEATVIGLLDKGADADAYPADHRRPL
jgi:hypothetical protein